MLLMMPCYAADDVVAAFDAMPHAFATACRHDAADITPESAIRQRAEIITATLDYACASMPLITILRCRLRYAMPPPLLRERYEKAAQRVTAASDVKSAICAFMRRTSAAAQHTRVIARYAFTALFERARVCQRERHGHYLMPPRACRHVHIHAAPRAVYHMPHAAMRRCFALMRRAAAWRHVGDSGRVDADVTETSDRDRSYATLRYALRSICDMIMMG